MRGGVHCCNVFTTYVTAWLFFSVSRVLHCCDPICYCGKVCCQGIPLVNHWIKCLQLCHDLPSKPLDKTQRMAKQHSCDKHRQSRKLFNVLHWQFYEYLILANCSLLQEHLVFAAISAGKKGIKIIQFLWQSWHSATQAWENWKITVSGLSLDCASFRTKCQPIIHLRYFKPKYFV